MIPFADAGACAYLAAMRMLVVPVAIAALAPAAPVLAEGIGADAAACGDPAAVAVLVHVTGLNGDRGTLRVQAYGPGGATFLQKGRYVRRVEVPVSGRGPVDVCLRLPGAGSYAVAVRHDANLNGKSDWNDGAGFSRNPRLSLFRLKPAFAQAAITAERGTARTSIVMNYRHGLSIGPEPTRGG